MNRLSDLTLGDIVKGLGRYRPFILTVVAIAMIAVLLPGHGKEKVRTDSGEVAGPQATPTQGQQPATNNVVETTIAGPGGAAPAAAGGAAPSGAATGGSKAAAGSGAAAKATTAGATPAAGAQAAATPSTDPNCDPATGRIRVPSVYAAPCVAPYDGNNGGATYQGVTADTITIAVYLAQRDATTTAVLAAGGDNDTQDQIKQTFTDYVDYFQHHYQTYGRKVKLVFVPGSGKTTDDTAGKADAIKVAKEIKAFMSIGSLNDAYVNELVADGVMCVCTTTLPWDYYQKRSPYVWGNGLPDQHQAYLMRAEVIGKQIAGGKAQWSDDATAKLKDRTFGLIWYNTGDNSYAPGVNFFKDELAKYNVHLADDASYIFDTGSAQQTADTIMSRFKSEGITDVIFSGDPIYPVFYTAAATKQNYHPEWIITGSALTDTTFFGRTYDKTQWKNAFGVSLLAARAGKEQADPFRLYKWQFGKEPPAKSEYSTVIYPPLFMAFTGIQLAGEKLTPEAFKNGMFSYEPAPKGGGITNGLISWGKKVWSWDDYNMYDDATLIWWDNAAQGPDELSNQGVGMYRYVDMGKRYMPGQIPTQPFKAFDPANTVTVYSDLPPSDKYPDYPKKDYY